MSGGLRCTDADQAIISVNCVFFIVARNTLLLRRFTELIGSANCARWIAKWYHITGEQRRVFKARTFSRSYWGSLRWVSTNSSYHIFLVCLIMKFILVLYYESPETLRKLCVSTKFSHYEIRWNLGILCSPSFISPTPFFSVLRTCFYLFN